MSEFEIEGLQYPESFEVDISKRHPTLFSDAFYPLNHNQRVEKGKDLTVVELTFCVHSLRR